MGVKVGVLGPLEVSRDGAGVPMRGKRRAALLTALVVSPGFAASRDRLIDAVWGEQLPRNPTHALESLVSQLRQNLSGPAAEIHLIEATNVGYALDKKMVDTDLAQFRNLIEQGQAHERNDPTAAVSAFSDALALWRGRPLDGIDLVMDLQPLITELDDLHISTREALLQLRLDLGHQDRVVGELQTLTAEYPFRERLWAMLMLALYRDGRQTEALRAGQEAREQLAEVGSEPGVELGDLELRILQQDESLHAPQSPAVVFISDDRPGTSEPVVVESPQSNLPDHLSSFVGRTRQLEELDALIATSRLVTLTGVGGTGKTRLSQQLAKRVADRFDDGVWIAELAAIADPSSVIYEIANAWGLRGGEGMSLEEVVSAFLRRKNLLLILDNCEHLLDAVVQNTKQLLEKASGVSILATSRESLGVPGEVIHHVPPMEVPSKVEGAESVEAVALFLDRARSTRPDLTFDHDDMESIVRICARVDGIPLGIELAAARLRSMTPAELSSRLGDSFAILSGKSSSPRQRTINATIQWSYDLLKPETRTLFGRLSVFAGGFDIEAVETVCAGDQIEDWQIVEQIDDLVDKSLVVAATEPGVATRFRLLEPIRQYAADRLNELGGTDTLSRRHADHFVAMCETAWPHLHGPRQLEWMLRIEADYDNIRAALATILKKGDIDAYLQTCMNLARAWQHDGLHLEAMDFFLAGLESGFAAKPRARIDAWCYAAELATDLTLPISVDYAERAVQMAERLGDPIALGKTHLVLGMAMCNTTTRDEEGSRLVVAGMEEVWAHPDPAWYPNEAWQHAYLNMCSGFFFPESHPEKAQRFKDGLDGFLRIGDPEMIGRARTLSIALWGLDEDWAFEQLGQAVESLRLNRTRGMFAHALMFWSLMAEARGLAAEVRAATDDAMPLLADLGDMSCSVQTAICGVNARIALGQVEDAVGLLSRAAAMIQTHQIEPAVPSLLTTAVEVAAALVDLDRAARLLGRAETRDLRARYVDRLAPHRESLQAALGERFDTLTAEGAAMSDAELIPELAAASL